MVLMLGIVQLDTLGRHCVGPVQNLVKFGVHLGQNWQGMSQNHSCLACPACGQADEDPLLWVWPGRRVAG